ncbi:hypothetical protein ACWC09_15970 [Streptomyces sp. NPDC001617]
MQPGPPFQGQPFGQGPVASGNPVGAVLLGFLVSFVISLVFSGVVVFMAEGWSVAASITIYLAYALLSGAIVGALIGKVGGGSSGARIGGAVIAALGAFFGWANAIPGIIAKEESFMALKTLLEAEPFFPAKAWWHNGDGGVDWSGPVSLVLAAAAAWGIAYLVGNKRGHS